MTWPDPPHPLDGYDRAVLVATVLLMLLWLVGAVTR